MFGLFERRPCFETPSSVYRASPDSPTYHADQLLMTATAIALNESARGAVGKELTEKFKDLKANDPQTYASFNAAIKKEGMQGDMYELMREHPTLVSQNFDRITKAGAGGLSEVMQDLEQQAAKLPSERIPASTAPVKRERVAATLEPYRAPEFRGMYDPRSQPAQPQQAPVMPVRVPQSAEAQPQISRDGFPPGSMGPVTNPAWGGGSFNTPFNPSALGNIQNFIRALIGFGGGASSGQDFSTASDGFQRYGHPRILSEAPSIRTPFNMGGQAYGNVMEGLGAGMRQGSLIRPGTPDMVMGGGIGGGLSQSGGGNLAGGISRVLQGMFDR